MASGAPTAKGGGGEPEPDVGLWGARKGDIVSKACWISLKH